jgi:hypothetical protein
MLSGDDGVLDDEVWPDDAGAVDAVAGLAEAESVAGVLAGVCADATDANANTTGINRIERKRDKGPPNSGRSSEGEAPRYGRYASAVLHRCYVSVNSL